MEITLAKINVTNTHTHTYIHTNTFYCAAILHDWLLRSSIIDKNDFALSSESAVGDESETKAHRLHCEVIKQRRWWNGKMWSDLRKSHLKRTKCWQAVGNGERWIWRVWEVKFCKWLEGGRFGVMKCQILRDSWSRLIRRRSSGFSYWAKSSFIFLFRFFVFLVVRQLAYHCQRFSCICTQYTFQVMIIRIFVGDNGRFSQLLANASLILFWVSRYRFNDGIFVRTYVFITYDLETNILRVYRKITVQI